MHKFLPEAIRLLQKYKLFLKKQSLKEENREILYKLQAHQTFPKDEVRLYRLLSDVVGYLKAEEETYKRIRFSGKLQILKDMLQLLRSYRLEKDLLLNTAQLTSRVIVEAIQLMALPAAKCTGGVVDKLKKCALQVAQYGTPQQKSSFYHSLEKQVERNQIFFLPIMIYYQTCLKKYAEESKEVLRLED